MKFTELFEAINLYPWTSFIVYTAILVIIGAINKKDKT